MLNTSRIDNLKKELFTNFGIKNKSYSILSLSNFAEKYNFPLQELPYSLRILLENDLRYNLSRNKDITKTIEAFKGWIEKSPGRGEVSFMPARVLMQDFTGVPAIVDLAAMRDAVADGGGDPLAINPLIPVDLVIDHSIQVDNFGNKDSLRINTEIESKRNYERYEFLRWGQKSFNNFTIVPPSTGICHQVNLEYLAKVVWEGELFGTKYLYPDSLVGTDSHTTMINGLGVLGWGVGGIEAEAAMLGQELSMLIPDVIGVRLIGKLKDGVTATDLVLTITELLRKYGVVGKFVEYFGEGIQNLTVADRATIANMSPEYGATCGFFPVDNRTLEYLAFSGRTQDLVDLVEKYTKSQHLFYDTTTQAKYTDIIELNLHNVEPCLAGPKRPQDRVLLSNVASNFKSNFENANIKEQNAASKVKNGDVVIAAITSCTNTSNPEVMIAAGILAKKAQALGLSAKSWVKTSLAPGSQVVSEYLKIGGLQTHLDALGFNIVGYGCTTCIGNSGPLDAAIEGEILSHQLVVAGVLSGNRNFEGRVHQLVKANYLASPPLVVAYAIAGTVNIDISKDSLAKDKNGNDVFLKDLWPSHQEIFDYMNKYLQKEMFVKKYADVFKGDDIWQNINIEASSTYHWKANSSYIKQPPYFEERKLGATNKFNIENARILAMFGDSITTDHISPAGNISKDSVAAKYLLNLGVNEKDFNSYGSRRGNHEVMMRGTFANKRIKNELCPGIEGSSTINHLNDSKMSIFEAAIDYMQHNIPSVVVAGREYGTGSSRDWAAKGPKLLGVRAVIAESFERIHRSNLVGMGILPLAFCDGQNRSNLGLIGNEVISITLPDTITPSDTYALCKIVSGDKTLQIKLKLEVYTDSELENIECGSILHKVVKDVLENSAHKELLALQFKAKLALGFDKDKKTDH
ncbi:MAG: aconitate hydratase AcnA [Rickettsiaceae bacterium]|nr:aconitate hydratase AcnA [Rickettsiaceae bacterium]